ncbi:DNA-binding transcriptional regulator HyfR [Escherichia coli]|nr:DNA-binding transcriptional regulator HyfR [Escherichia coli]MCQ5673399.1 DNA-binding transcriptional regulator HyfR [Escherichia coli]MCQ5687631.1 DNA-binding transcriptional regulator HyfR [Escherichia coli]MCQ5702424.1 DNA-binding transcriptional regulator HyfR [Escherichia coli]MCQ5726371.1 DNA-binding transcriptional regulator HyfR [Escherichia coli]
MAMSDEAMFAPPQGITIEAVNGMLAERLAQKHGKASLLRAFIPLPPPFSPVQLIELHVLKSNFYYRYHDDGSDVTATTEYQGEMVDYSRHAVLLGSSGMAELRFIRTHGSRFTSQDCTLFNWLARIITPVLQSWLNDEEQQVALRLLEKDRDHHRVLVDITNAVLSHLDLDDLIADVAREIHHFFGLASVSMVLGDHRKNEKFSLWCSDLSASHCACLPRCMPGESVLLTQTLQTRQPTLTHRADDLFLWQRDPLLLLLASNGCESALLIPLTFGNHTPGALLLAHTSSTLFSEENCQLLQHIADRIAIAVGNADAWRSMTDLQESLQQENHQLSEQLLSNLGIGDIIYQSQAMEDLLQQVDIVAKSDSTVLICGETGTGKEVIARAIHQLSPRRDKPLVKINCAAISASLLESELFGHDKGAFTGAINTHRGRFEIADGGTLFLDEIGDLPLELQPKLLRVLQEREIERLGGSRTIPVNVRVIAATNRDLWQMVEDRQFRSDLFYRLNVFPLELPPLRDRPEDIPLLAKHFTQKMARHMNRAIDAIPTEALRQLMSWDWPGNVRELENVIERAVLLTRGNSLNLHLNVRQSRLLPTLNEDSALRSSMAQLLHPTTPENDEEERQRIVQVLRETNGIVAGPRGAATRLGMKRTTLLLRMQRLGISVREVL